MRRRRARGRPRVGSLLRKLLVGFSYHQTIKGLAFRTARRWPAAGVVAVVAITVPFTHGVASGAGKVVLGGGAGIVVDGNELCTLTAIGNDNRGNLVGFTSAHCGSPNSLVAAEAAPEAGVVGTMVAGSDKLDYAVIQFDPNKVTPVDNFKGFLISGIGPDPTVGQVACKLGRTTGYSCGVTWGPGQQPGTIINQDCGQPGDSGAPVTVDNKLVGMIHGAFSGNLPVCVVKFIPLHTPAVTYSMNAVLGDVNTRNRPGAGFVPVGG